MTSTREAIIGLVIIILVLVGIIWYAMTRPAPVAPSPETPAPIETAVGPQYIREQGQFYAMDVQYPGSTMFKESVGTDADAKAVLTMKTYFTDTVIPSFKEAVDGNAQAVADFQARGEEVPASFQHLSLNAEYETHQSGHTVSYVFLVSEDSGGAHPNSYYHTFTFDTQTGEELSLGDLFSGNDYRETLSKISRDKLPAMLAERENVAVADVDTEMLNAGTAPTATNFQSFYLDSSNLVLLFSPYEIGPYVLGATELPISRSTLAGLKAEYK